MRGRVPKDVSPTTAFCLFRVGRRVSGVEGIGIFLSDVGSSVLKLLSAWSDCSDVRMMTVSVEGRHVSLEWSFIDNDTVEVFSSILVSFLSDFAPMEFGRGVFKECKEIFFGELLSLGIREEKLLCTETGLSSDAGHWDFRKPLYNIVEVSPVPPSPFIYKLE